MAQQEEPGAGGARTRRPAGDEPKKPLLTRIGEQWHAFHSFVWNSEKKEFIGRTGKSCGQITLFYICFYVCLVGFWAMLFAIFYQTVSLDKPKYNSLITPPGLNLVPFPTDGRLISYGLSDMDEDRIRIELEIRDQVFNVFERDQSTFENCDDLEPDKTAVDPPITQRFCKYKSSLLGPCAPITSGYNTMEPCLYINLNKVWGWIPENYEVVPDELNQIRNQLNLNTSTNNRIIVTCVKCDTNNKCDNPIEMYPSEGIPFGHYPYVLGTDMAQQARYIRPIVAAKVKIDTVGEVVKINCRAWAKNLDETVGGLFYSRSEPARFTVRVMVKK